MSKTLKRIITAGVSVILTAALVFGILIIVKVARRKPVNVYLVSDVGTNYFGYGGGETYGDVTSDKLQKVYLSQTQTLKEFLVSEGDTVIAGDPLLKYDTELGERDVKKASIALEKLKLEKSSAEAMLESLNYAVISENVEGQIRALEESLEAEEERIAALAPVYPKLPLGSFTSDDPYYTESADKIDLDEYVSGMVPGDEKYVVFVTVADGEYVDYKGVVFAADEAGKISFGFFDADPLEGEIPEHEDHREELRAKIDALCELMGKSYTYAELADAKIAKMKEIKDLEVQIKRAELNYKQKSEEVGDGVIYAKIDGVVKTVREDADGTGEATLVLSGGGGYIISCGIGEFDLDALHVGDTVNVTSWFSGAFCTGTVVDIDTSSVFRSDYYYSDGNPNISTYKMTVSVDESEELEEGESVSVSYEKSSGGDVWYLSNMFIRYENGRAYVMVKSDGGTLEKRFIQTGVDLYGEYTEIRGMLDPDDRVAFPYGSDTVDGAKTVDASVEDLYGDDYFVYY